MAYIRDQKLVELETLKLKKAFGAIRKTGVPCHSKLSISLDRTTNVLKCSKFPSLETADAVVFTTSSAHAWNLRGAVFDRDGLVTSIRLVQDLVVFVRGQTDSEFRDTLEDWGLVCLPDTTYNRVLNATQYTIDLSHIPNSTSATKIGDRL